VAVPRMWQASRYGSALPWFAQLAYVAWAWSCRAHRPSLAAIRFGRRLHSSMRAAQPERQRHSRRSRHDDV